MLKKAWIQWDDRSQRNVGYHWTIDLISTAEKYTVQEEE